MVDPLLSFFAIPGLRLGALIASEELVKTVRTQMFSWSVNELALSVGVHALNDTEYKDQTLKTVKENKAWLQEKLSQIPKITVRDSSVNYLLCRISDHNVKDLKLELLTEHKIAIRDCYNYENLDNSHFRIAVKKSGRK